MFGPPDRIFFGAAAAARQLKPQGQCWPSGAPCPAALTPRDPGMVLHALWFISPKEAVKQVLIGKLHERPLDVFTVPRRQGSVRWLYARGVTPIDWRWHRWCPRPA